LVLAAGEMRMRCVAWVLCAAALAGCAKEVPIEEQPIWGRFDCRRQADDPEVAMLFEQAKTICVNRAEAAAVAGTTAIPVGRGIAGAIASGIERGQAQNEIGTATTLSCMAEQGWARKPRAEHEAVCAPVAAKREAELAAALKGKPKRPPASPAAPKP
jgi:hypothetical protein